jgi:hemerythrin superfamily protein
MHNGRGWLSTGNMAAFAGGAVAAVVASRMLPPLMAQAVGSARAAAGRDPFDALIKDHRHFVELLSEMERSPNDAVFQRTQLLLRLKRRLTAHALAEEDVIYPMLHDRANAVEDARHLYEEHAEMKIHLHALEQMPKGDPRWLDRVGALKALIQTHARQEEEIDFPKLRQLLSDRQTTRLSGSLQREKAFVL